jgi:hypothetical protein
MIYFIATETMTKVKIGYTDSDIMARLKAIQIHSPVLLKLVKLLKGDQRDEMELHKRFTDYRDHGEWFCIKGDLSEFLKNDKQDFENLEEINYKKLLSYKKVKNPYRIAYIRLPLEIANNLDRKAKKEKKTASAVIKDIIIKHVGSEEQYLF